MVGSILFEGQQNPENHPKTESQSGTDASKFISKSPSTTTATFPLHPLPFPSIVLSSLSYTSSFPFLSHPFIFFLFSLSPFHPFFTLTCLFSSFLSLHYLFCSLCVKAKLQSITTSLEVSICGYLSQGRSRNHLGERLGSDKKFNIRNGH